MTKDREKLRASWRRWYARHKDRKDATQARMRSERRRWLQEFKRGLSCTRCGESHPACLAFHHRSGVKKEFTISRAVQAVYSRSRIEAEIAKCVVLCHNCHLKDHAIRRSLVGLDT